MQEAVAKLKYQYRDALTHDEKSKIAHKVLHAVTDKGGRFMKYDDTSKQWCELEYKVTLNKIYHSIRDALYNDAPQEMTPNDATNNLVSSTPLGKQNSTAAARQGMGRSFHLPLHGNQARATPAATQHHLCHFRLTSVGEV